MFRYVLGFILAVVIITAGIVAIVILYDEETLASRPADAEEAASRGTESKQLAPEPTRATSPASPTPAPTVLPLPTLPPLPKATPYPAGDPELYGAIWRGTRDAESLQALVNEGREVNASNDQGDPFLYTAIWRASPEKVQILVDAGADVNARDSDNDPPVRIAPKCCGFSSRRCGCQRARQR